MSSMTSHLQLTGRGVPAVTWACDRHPLIRHDHVQISPEQLVSLMRGSWRWSRPPRGGQRGRRHPQRRPAQVQRGLPQGDQLLRDEVCVTDISRERVAGVAALTDSSVHNVHGGDVNQAERLISGNSAEEQLEAGGAPSSYASQRFRRRRRNTPVVKWRVRVETGPSTSRTGAHKRCALGVRYHNCTGPGRGIVLSKRAQ